jgi:tetratricopeptide (TPR) repeat protein
MSDDRPHFYEFGPFRVDPAQRVLLRGGRLVALQPKAFEILIFLVRNPENHVLDALGSAAADLRARLGESLNSVQKYDAPPEAVTTPSLEALQAYSAGYRTMINRNDYPAAIPLFERAITLDPSFAMARARLGINFFNLGEPDRAEDSLRKAYELSEHLSEREKLYITASYNAMATRDFEAARQGYESWAQIYPRDQFAVGNLGVVYGYLGDYEQALTAVQAAWKLDPQNALVFSNIVQVLLQLNRLDEAKEMGSKAKSLNLDSPSLQSNLYMVGFCSGIKREWHRQPRRSLISQAGGM